MGDFVGEQIPSKRAEHVVLAVVSRWAMIAMAAMVPSVLVWGFNRVDTSITKLTDTVNSVLIEQREHKVRIEALERAGLGGQRP